jgi:hypothetical protein
MRQNIDINSLVVREPGSKQSLLTVSFLRANVASGSSADAVFGESELPAAHYEQVYRTRLEDRRARGSEHSGMEEAIADLQKWNGRVRVVAVDHGSGHAVLFLDENGQVVTGFLEPSGDS